MTKRRYGRGKFEAHANYIRYMSTIASHKNYKGMPNAMSDDGHINWQVSSGKTTSFYEFYNDRFNWWVKKADALRIPGAGNSLDRFSIAARRIHPTGYRPCRICGKELNVGYFYLNHFLVERWNSMVKRAAFKIGQPIDEATGILRKELGEAEFRSEVRNIFPEREDIFPSGGITKRAFELSNYLRSRYLSPGFMCNPPDRLDGFHDYGLCCRKTKDPGRSDENLRSYQHDRRTFRWWAEGDWNVADALFTRAGSGKCERCGIKVAKISPDHIGPLSCGFKQIPFFRPLCQTCNSSKNRRMSADDVQILISYESKNNMSVASWQVHALWDKWKHEVKTDLQARQLSTAMRALEDFYLRTLYELYKINRVCFLASLLSPQYAFYDVEFDNLDPSKLTFDKIMKTKKISVNKQSMAARIIRIAVEELLEYVAKPIESRKVKKYFWEPYKVYIQKIIKKAMEYELSHYDEKWNNVIIMDVANELKEKHILHLLKKDYTRKPKGRDELKRYMVAIFNDIGESAPIF